MSELVEVGRYRRELGASIERMIENALDWEHLPFTHAGSFASIRLVEQDADGFRAVAALPNGHPVSLHLRLTDDGWVTRTEVDGVVASEIRTEAAALGADRCRVDVRFLVPDPGEGGGAIGAFYERLYATLYDEDERLMITRAEAIRRGPAALKARRAVTLPDGTAATAPVYCPHQGLPLNDAIPDQDGIIVCPWHGYRVDIASGRCSPPHPQA